MSSASAPKKRKLIPDFVPVVPINIGDEVNVLINEEGRNILIKGIVNFVSPCEWLITESKYAEFFDDPPNIDTVDLTSYPKFAEALTRLRVVMTLEQRKYILREMIEWDNSELPEGYKIFLKNAYMMIKRNQIISVVVKYKDLEPITLWYEAYNCNPVQFMPFVDGYGFSKKTLSNFPTIKEGVFHSDDVEKYGLLNTIFERNQNGPQVISSWITRGFLSTWLRKHDEVSRNLLHPFIGDEEFVKYIDIQQSKDFETLYAISITSTEDIETYRSSLFWIDTFEPIVSESIVASTTNFRTALLFHSIDKRPIQRVKKLIISSGVRFLDLSKFNLEEREILILPDIGKLLSLIPVKRGTYAITNDTIGPTSIKNLNTYRVTGGGITIVRNLKADKYRKSRRNIRRTINKTRRN